MTIVNDFIFINHEYKGIFKYKKIYTNEKI